MTFVRDPGLRPFHESSYEILDGDFPINGQLTIWSIDPLPPQAGDLYMIESHGKLHEVEVTEVRRFTRGWTARCKLYGLADS